jgi:pyruvate kinase
MIHNLREAERETGRSCKIYADLGGPKLRTGALAPAGRLLELRPQRGVRGEILEPARVWVVARDRVGPPAVPVDAVLPVDPDLLALAVEDDRLELEDCRGPRRALVVVRRIEGGLLALGRSHVYLEEGAACSLTRGGLEVASGRVGPLPARVLPLVLLPGDTLWLTDESTPGRPAERDARGRLVRPASIPCTLDAVFSAVAPGQAVWLDDGRIGGAVVRCRDRVVEVEITHAAPGGSKLRSEKGINLPDTAIDVPALTPEDHAHLRALAPLVDLVGLSFVRRPEDVLALHEALDALDAAHLGVVLKIETRPGFEHLPSILLAALRRPRSGIMVARGDLAVEVGFERLAEVQEEILWLAEAAHVPVIWATQVLESMTRTGLPSRAEVSDAAHGVRAECVMLNKGPHIVATTRFLSGVLERMGAHRTKNRSMMRRLAVSKI